MKLKEIRLLRGMTQRQVADYLDCAPSVYSRYETGDRVPSIDVLIKLSRCLGTSIDSIVGNDLVADNALTSYEIALVEAARHADERAREDALAMLETHRVSEQKENPA